MTLRNRLLCLIALLATSCTAGQKESWSIGMLLARENPRGDGAEGGSVAGVTTSFQPYNKSAAERVDELRYEWLARDGDLDAMASSTAEVEALSGRVAGLVVAVRAANAEASSWESIAEAAEEELAKARNAEVAAVAKAREEEAARRWWQNETFLAFLKGIAVLLIGALVGIFGPRMMKKDADAAR